MPARGKRKAPRAAGLITHSCASGRARIAVPGLRDNAQLAQRVRERLALLSGVSKIQPRTATGNVVVRFAAPVELKTIVNEIALLLNGRDEARVDRQSWHAMAEQEVVAALNTSAERGLSGRAAQARLDAVGPNELRVAPPRSPAEILASQFKSAPVALLGGAFALSLLTGGMFEAAVVAGVLGLNAAIGYAAESRTERLIGSFGKTGSRQARAIRDGVDAPVPAGGLVPGDVIAIQAGDVAPADSRLIETSGLTMSEAPLTGESLPVSKRSGALGAGLPLAARSNMVYRGTIAIGGGGKAIVTATGARTEVGRVKALVDSARPPQTPLQRELTLLGGELLRLTMGASGLLMIAGLLRRLPALQILRLGLSLAVAAIPEGLPMLATVALAMRAKSLQQRNILVRRLHCVETLGAVRVVCFDKTGTLTHNRMSVAEVACGGATYRAGQAGALRAALSAGRLPLQQLLVIGCLCSSVELGPDDEPLDGSETERCLLLAAAANGVEAGAVRRRFPLVAVQHRTDASRLMATIHQDGAGRFIAVKGATPDVLARCSAEMDASGEVEPLTAARRDAIVRDNEAMGARGLRVLGFAFGRANGEDSPRELGGLTWVGLAGLADQARPQLEPLMRKLHRAGIHTVMLTGDQRSTARTIAEQAGLGEGNKIEMRDAASLPHRLDLADPEIGQVFARVTPGQKLEIVRALQRSGAVVAMVGDGTNDSPALRGADIGLAMGRNGDAAAQEVADAYLSDDDLSHLVEAIEHGRATYDNIRRLLRFLLGTNASEIALTVVLTAASGAAPLTPSQLLWINLVTDVLPALGLGLEQPDDDVMLRNADEYGSILDAAEMLGVARDGGLLASSAVVAGLYGGLRYGLPSPRTGTIMFSALVIAQLLHALTCRGRRKSGKRNTGLNAIVAGTLAGHAGTLSIDKMRRILQLRRMSPPDWLVTLAAGALPFAVGQIGKLAPAPAARTLKLDRPDSTAPPAFGGAAEEPARRPTKPRQTREAAL